MLQHLLQGRLDSRDFPCWCSPVPTSQCPAVLALVAGPMTAELCVLLGFVPHWAAPLDVVLKLLFWIAGLRLKSALACYLNCVWSCVSWGEQRAGQNIPSLSSGTCYPWLPLMALFPCWQLLRKPKPFKWEGEKVRDVSAEPPFLLCLPFSLPSGCLSWAIAGSSSLLEVSHPATDRL